MNIGEAAKSSGVSAKLIRYYESIELIRPAQRTESGYRQYSKSDVYTLRFIKRSRELGFSIERIKSLLQLWRDSTRKSAEVKKLAQEYIAELDQNIEQLQSIRDQLKQFAQCCQGDANPHCPILEELAVGSPSHEHKPG